jgi:hypothetical protein
LIYLNYDLYLTKNQSIYHYLFYNDKNCLMYSIIIIIYRRHMMNVLKDLANIVDFIEANILCDFSIETLYKSPKSS